ncbi:hypothetical protein [Streptomyces olivochromogenes]|uniref:hypothetical protein n=1 Tax=Streptomyces olivochromogenes TaxID=1963 RepID=UPI001F1A281C|nr:hypothetical protein [Streptomyces olivochromogenes]MCF3131964.1 hypothetical protein [Streptomyces olivochromogenes]
MEADIDTLLRWLADHSLPVVAGLAAGAGLLYIIRLIIDRFVEKGISLAFRERELHLESRSAFEDRVLEDRFRLFNDIVTRLVRITTDLNRVRRGRDATQEPFLQDGELFPLTQVFEDCELHRLVLGEELYAVLINAARVVLQLVQADSEEQYRTLGGAWIQVLDKVRKVGEENFGLSRIKWRERSS